MDPCEHFRISGRVQGVGFRAATQACAQQLGLRGWVRNLPDGQVEVLAAGECAALEKFRRWLAQGPRAARVEAVTSRPATADGLEDGFHIR